MDDYRCIWLIIKLNLIRLFCLGTDVIWEAGSTWAFEVLATSLPGAQLSEEQDMETFSCAVVAVAAVVGPDRVDDAAIKPTNNTQRTTTWTSRAFCCLLNANCRWMPSHRAPRWYSGPTSINSTITWIEIQMIQSPRSMNAIKLTAYKWRSLPTWNYRHPYKLHTWNNIQSNPIHLNS